MSPLRCEDTKDVDFSCPRCGSKDVDAYYDDQGNFHWVCNHCDTGSFDTDGDEDGDRYE